MAAGVADPLAVFAVGPHVGGRAAAATPAQTQIGIWLELPLRRELVRERSLAGGRDRDAVALRLIRSIARRSGVGLFLAARIAHRKVAKPDAGTRAGCATGGRPPSIDPHAESVG